MVQSSELITGVLNDARELAVAEVDKLKAEAKQVGQTARITGIALALLVVAAMMLGEAVAYGLGAAGLPLWGAFAIVTAVYAAIGIYVMKRPRDVPSAV